MSSLRSGIPPRLSCALLSALLTVTPCLATRDTEVVTQEDEASAADILRADLFTALHTLWTGRPEEKRAIVEDAESWSAYLSEAGPEDEPARRAVDWLRTLVRIERDDWITSRLLQNLAEERGTLLNPLYLDALEEPSLNLRWRAIQWFQSHPDPEARPLLENLWRIEERPWVRTDLMEALGVNSSDRYVEDFVSIARAGDSRAALAAVHALGSLHDPRFIPDLAALARSAGAPVRVAALRALASWPDSEQALDSVLSAGAEGDIEMLARTIPLLGNFSSQGAIDRLLELASPGWAPAVRVEAVDTLAAIHPDGYAELLVEILHEPDSAEMSSLQSEAIWQLHALDDPNVARELRDLDPSLGGQGFRNLAGLIADLSRDRSSQPRGNAWVRTACGMGRFVAAEDENDRAIVQPPDGLHTVRCWEFPDVTGDPEEFQRMAAGSEVWIEDHFEHGNDSWVGIVGNIADRCWVPVSQIRSASTPGSRQASGAPDPHRLEFDLRFEEFEGNAALRLRDAGLLEMIEPGSEVVGVALSLHPADAGSLAELAAAYRDDGSRLDEEVAQLLNSLVDSPSDAPALIDFFKHHPDVRQKTGDTRGDIDLDSGSTEVDE